MRMCHFWAQNGPFVMNKFFFWYKPLLLLSSIYWPFSLCKFFKKFLQQIWSYVPFLGPKWPICPKQTLFWKINNITLIYLLAPFHCAKFKKILTADPELWGCIIFGPKMDHLPQTFFWKTININLIYPLAPFIGQNFKKILPVDPELWGCTIFGSKMAHLPKWEFFPENLLISLVSSTHAYLHAKNQSQILIY